MRLLKVEFLILKRSDTSDFPFGVRGAGRHVWSVYRAVSFSNFQLAEKPKLCICRNETTKHIVSNREALYYIKIIYRGLDLQHIYITSTS